MSAPGIAAKLVGGGDLVLQIDRGFFGFNEKLACTANTEGIIGRFGNTFDFDTVLKNDIFIVKGVTLLVINVPSEGGKKGSMNSRRAWASL